jgi:hypothetical protein
MEQLALPPDTFVDACLLAGSALLPTFPQLDARKPNKIRAAAEMIRTMGGSGNAVIQHYSEDPQVRAMDYLTRFRKVRMAIKHHVVIAADGTVEPLEIEQAPNDVHVFMGQRLPEELYFYLTRGIIGPRVLNWRTTGEILEWPPLDNGDSEQYQSLVRDQLITIKTTTIALLSFSLHRFYQHNNINMRCWFDKDNVRVINMREVENPRPLVDDWNVHEEIYGPEMNKHLGNVSHTKCLI